MAGVKYQEKVYFPQGHIWVLMDEEWGVEIVGESSIDGNLVSMGCWEFNARSAWMQWGDHCIEQIQALKNQFGNKKITEVEVVKEIYQLDKVMSPGIKKSLLDDFVFIHGVAN